MEGGYLPGAWKRRGFKCRILSDNRAGCKMVIPGLFFDQGCMSYARRSGNVPYRPPLLGAGEPGEHAVTVRLGGPNLPVRGCYRRLQLPKPLA